MISATILKGNPLSISGHGMNPRTNSTLTSNSRVSSQSDEKENDFIAPMELMAHEIIRLDVDCL